MTPARRGIGTVIGIVLGALAGTARAGTDCAQTAAVFIDNRSSGIDCDTSATVLIDNRQTVISVYASAAFNPATKILAMSAIAHDAATGQFVTTGTASYEVDALGIAGILSPAGSGWTATKNLTSNPPPPGDYLVRVQVNGGTGSAGFQVAGSSPGIRGSVENTLGNPVPGALVRLHRNTDFFAGEPPLLEQSAGAGGGYSFPTVASGWYVVSATSGGYVGDYTVVRHEAAAETVRDLVLESGDSLAQLRGPMDNLYRSIRDAMDADTRRMAQISEQAMDSLNAKIDVWTFLSAAGSVMAGAASLGQGALQYIAQTASRETIDKVLTSLIAQKALDTLALESVEAVIETSSRQLLPPSLHEWKAWTFEELAEILAYERAMQGLEGENASFQQEAPFLGQHPSFNAQRARELIQAQQLQMERLTRGELINVVALADPARPFLIALLPTTNQVWLMNHVAISFFGGAGKVATTIKLGFGAAAVGSAMTGVGVAWAPVLGTIAGGAATTGEIVKAVELSLQFVGGWVYFMNIKAWVQDMVSIPVTYVSTRAIITRESADPHYLRTGESFDAEVSTDLNAPIEISGVPYLYTLLHMPIGASVAQVNVTNTGSTQARIRVVASGWWDYRLPGDRGWIGEKLFGGVTLIKIPVSFAAQFADLSPGAAQSFGIPYVGVFADPVNAFSPHRLRVDVYSGPYLVHSSVHPYYVIPTPLAAAGAEGDAPPFDLTYLSGASAVAVGADNVGDFAPAFAKLLEQSLSAANPEVTVPFTVGDDVFAVRFELQADPSAVMELLVCDAEDRCVGADSEYGGKRQEFPAEYGGDQSQQSVEIPISAGETYQVRARLVGTTSAASAYFSLWAIETPARPAVMALSPSTASHSLHPGLTTDIAVAVSEAGQQQPLTDVQVDADLLLPVAGGAPALELEPLTALSTEVVAAGHAASFHFRLRVPSDTPAGEYRGTIQASSTNAGAQSSPLIVVVPPRGDLNADGAVDSCDFAQLFTLRPDCMLGPGTVSPEECLAADLDGDGKVELEDVAIFLEKRMYVLAACQTDEDCGDCDACRVGACSPSGRCVYDASDCAKAGN